MDTDTITARPALADLPARDVLAVDGRGDPEAAAFATAVRALFATRAALGAREDVALEGSYAQDGDPLRFDLDAPDGWHWTLVVPAPPWRSATAVATAGARFGAQVRLRHQHARRVARLLHHGPYADEGPSLAALYGYVAAAGLRPAGPHTETYLTDPRSCAPADLRTVLHVPVRAAP
jgi:hypothetical protein